MSELAARPIFLRLMARYTRADDYPSLAHRRRFERHLSRVLPRLRGLDADVNRDAVALLAVESFVRPAPARTAEYAAWALASLARSKWLDSLSMGPAQIQLRHWQRLGEMTGTGFNFERLRRARDLRAGYGLCLRLLEEGGVSDAADPAELARLYTGGARPRYVELLSLARERV